MVHGQRGAMEMVKSSWVLDLLYGEWIAFAERLNVECERKRVVRMFLAWAPGRIEQPFTEMEKILGGSDLERDAKSSFLDTLSMSCLWDIQ